MKVILLSKGDPSEVPLVMSVAILLHERGNEVDLICGRCNEKTQNYLSERGIKIQSMQRGGRRASNSRLKTLHEWWAYRRFVRNAAWPCPANTVFWIASGDTAMSLAGLRFGGPVILHLHELYDENPFYRRIIKKRARSATAVVCPEQHRALILRAWFSLKYTPHVLPNKPLIHPRIRFVGRLHSAVTDVLSKAEGRKILLYQGHIYPDRRLDNFAEAAHMLRSDWAFVVMGAVLDDDYYANLKAVCPDLIHVPFQTPPDHLYITSIADVGLVKYEATSLNNLFCAPNKVWEYAGFGIPFIGNKLPGLDVFVRDFNAGILANDSPSCIAAALSKILADYEGFRARSQKLFDSVNLGSEIDEIICSVKRGSVSACDKAEGANS